MPNAKSWTGEVVDAKSNKFYRVYSIEEPGGGYVVTQYGSQGSGRTGGTFSVAASGTPVTDARNAKMKKRAYGTVLEIDFDVDVARFKKALQGGDKAAGEFLDNIHTAAVASQGKDVNAGITEAKKRQRAERQGQPVVDDFSRADGPVTVQKDRLDAFAEKALAALTLSTTDVAAATKVYGELSEELEDLQEEFRKATSFLGTVELMITDALTK
jgi:hypothetical protein